MVQNRHVTLVSRPSHEPQESNFQITSSEIDLQESTLKQGEILVKTQYLSMDPYLRGSMGLPGDAPSPSKLGNISQFKGGDAILDFGETFGGRAAGVVVQSKNPKIVPGDLVASDYKWSEYVVLKPDEDASFEKLDKNFFTTENEQGKIPLSTTLGVLGVSGSHAYWGYKWLDPKPNETLVVSSAAGNIGVIVSQIGKINGIKTVGIAGGAKAGELEKRNLCDIGIDYRAHNGDVTSLNKALKEACPKGIDVYFDNSRGFISDAVYELLNPGARVYVCGGVATYNNGSKFSPYAGLPQLEGVKIITAWDFMSTYVAKIPEARAVLADWILAGKLKYFEHITKGFENAPRAFVGMYKGENFGKAIVHV
eukprot:Phypoly_transcript_11236.p1 GENE.Phypoly_transcript_11236~~Phypoly_transcript_11236.p1  ORF type:complete len:367 (+),score=56.06 Phypoly_transcript_11236:101-1201(+)